MSDKLNNIRTKLLATKELLEKSYEGFDKLKGELAHERGVNDPGALAAAIGRKKYGKGKFEHAAAKGKKMKKDEEARTGELDEKVREKMRQVMDHRNFGDKEAANHQLDIDESIPAKQRTNMKMARQRQNMPKPKLSVVKEEDFRTEPPPVTKAAGGVNMYGGYSDCSKGELVKYNEHGQWDFRGETLSKANMGNWLYNNETGNFNHPLHGSVAIRHKENPAHGLEVVHNAKVISSHAPGDSAGALQSASTHMKNLASAASNKILKGGLGQADENTWISENAMKEEVSENQDRYGAGED